MKNIYILPTDKPSRLHLGSSDLILCDLVFNSTTINSQNIYITNDDEIKEGDWVIFNELEIVKCTYSKNGEFLFSEPLTSSSNHHFSYFKKIILTTDQSLDGVQAIDDEFLEWFVKNPSCEEVEVIKVPYFDESGYSYLLIIPKEVQKQHIIDIMQEDEKLDLYEEPKQETLEDVIYQAIGLSTNEQGIINQALATFNVMKILQERSYSERDMREAFRQGHKSSRQLGSYNKITEQEDFNKWFEKFKKKV